MLKQLFKVFTLFLLCSLSDSSETERHEQLWEERFKSVRQRIQDAVRNDDAVSVAVAVGFRGKIIWEEAFGFSDRGEKIPATVHTRYPIASLSKPFTATGIMILAQRKLIDLTKPANDYLGAAPLQVMQEMHKKLLRTPARAFGPLDFRI